MQLLRRQARSLALAAFIAASLATFSGIAMPSGALAAGCDEGTVPPGNAEVDQYAESIPGGCGNVPFNGDGNGGNGGGSGGGDGGSSSSGGGSDSGSSLPSGTEQALNSQGPDGSATAAIAKSTAPAGAKAAGFKIGEAGVGALPSAAGLQSSDDGDSPVTAVLAALGEAFSGGSGSGGEGIGIAMPLLLGVILIAGLVFVLRRRLRE